MKKTLSVILAVVMALSVFAVTAFAAGTPVTDSDNGVFNTQGTPVVFIFEDDNVVATWGDGARQPISPSMTIVGKDVKACGAAINAGLDNIVNEAEVAFDGWYLNGVKVTENFADDAIYAAQWPINNVIEGIENDGEYAATEYITFVAVGDGMSNAEPADGDVRYCPVSWATDEDKICGEFADNNYSAEFINITLGSHTLTVTFEKQVYADGNWVSVNAETTAAEEKSVNYSVFSENVIEGVAAEYTATLNTVEFEAVGEGVDNEEPEEGDVRYLPVSWADDEDGICGEFTEGNYTAEFVNLVLGEHTLAVTFERQVYTGGEWVTTVNSDTEAPVIEVKEVNYAVNSMSSVEGVYEEYPETRTITFEVFGEGMDNEAPEKGDIRYCPVCWETDEDKICGAFEEAVYGARYTNRVFGEHVLAVTLERQEYKDGEWVTVCDADGNPVVEVKEVSYYVGPNAEEEKEIIFPMQILKYIYALLSYLVEKIVSLIG